MSKGASKQRQRRRQIALEKHREPLTTVTKRIQSQAKGDFEKRVIVAEHMVSRSNASLETAKAKAEEIDYSHLGEFASKQPKCLSKATHTVLSSDKQKSLAEIEKQKERKQLAHTAIKLYRAECKQLGVTAGKFTELAKFQQDRFVRMAGAYLAGTYKGTLRV